MYMITDVKTDITAVRIWYRNPHGV